MRIAGACDSYFITPRNPMTPRGTSPTSTHVNPLYKAKEEKKDEETQHSEEKKLGTLVPKKKKRTEFIPRKYKSTTPRGSKAAAERRPQNITLIPPRPEKIEGGLTKIDRPSFLSSMPGAVSPRDQFQSSEASKIRRENIYPDTIDEGRESSGESSKTGSSEEQRVPVAKSPQFTVDELKSRIPNKKPPPLPIAVEKPSRSKRGKPASASRSNLGVILSPRERKNLPESMDSEKAPSNEADFRERRKIPLLRADRVLKLEERVEASGLPRAQTQRGVAPKPEEMFRAFPKEPEGENLEALDATLSAKIEITSPDLIDSEIAIPSSSGPMQSEKAIPDDADEFVERSEEFPDEKDSSSETKDPQEGVQKQARPKSLMHRKGLSKVNPRTSNDLAETIKYLIKVEPSPEVGTVRALNALYSAAGGTVPIDPNQPETRVYADKLSNVPSEQRYEYLKALFDQLEFHLPPAVKREIRSSLANLYSHTYIMGDDSFIKGDLASIRMKLEKQLADL
jgi:hypothetical protein